MAEVAAGPALWPLEEGVPAEPAEEAAWAEAEGPLLIAASRDSSG